MPVFFNGRLIVTPAAASRVDDSAMFNRNPGVGNVLAVIGTADGGQPKTPLRFGSPAEAAAVLRGGPLLDCIQRAANPSSEVPGPTTIVAMRVNPATQAVLTLADAAVAPVIDLASQQYGALANRTSIQIEAGTSIGKKITVKLDTEVYAQDNVGRNVATITYGGAQATAVVNLTATTMVLQAPAGTTVATLDLTAYTKMSELVERISAVSGWTASVTDGAGEHPTANALDFITGGVAKSVSLPVTAHLNAIVEYLNGAAEPLVTATRRANVGTMPANIAATYLSGAVTGTTVTQDWADGFTALQLADVQWVTPATSDPAVHALTSAHCAIMSDVMKRERRSWVGAPLATTDAGAIILAKALNSDRVGLVHLGVYDFDTKGKLILYPPYVAAAMVAGGFSGVNPGTAMTNKALRVQGLERKLRVPTDTDALLLAGVCPLIDTPTGFRVCQSITTWLTNSNFNRREMSVGAATDYLARAVREAVDPIIGKKGNLAMLVEARARVISCLDVLAIQEPQGIGVLAGDADNPPWIKKSLQLSLVGDALAITFQASPVIPVNYVTISIFAVPYSATVTG